jgi:hypothetical protein
MMGGGIMKNIICGIIMRMLYLLIVIMHTLEAILAKGS